MYWVYAWCAQYVVVYVELLLIIVSVSVSVSGIGDCVVIIISTSICIVDDVVTTGYYIATADDISCWIIILPAW